MNISEMPDNIIAKYRDKALAGQRKHLCPTPQFAWLQGWAAAIRFAKRAEESIAVCEQCGKIIRNIEDFQADAEGVAFCAKCYDKVFQK